MKTIKFCNEAKGQGNAKEEDVGHGITHCIYAYSFCSVPVGKGVDKSYIIQQPYNGPFEILN